MLSGPESRRPVVLVADDEPQVLRMLALALSFPEYAPAARRTRIVETSAERFYGKGYQDVQDRRPDISAIRADFGWRPLVTLDESLAGIFRAYRDHVEEARHLADAESAG